MFLPWRPSSHSPYSLQTLPTLQLYHHGLKADGLHDELPSTPGPLFMPCLPPTLLSFPVLLYTGPDIVIYKHIGILGCMLSGDRRLNTHIGCKQCTQRSVFSLQEIFTLSLCRLCQALGLCTIYLGIKEPQSSPSPLPLVISCPRAWHRPGTAAEHSTGLPIRPSQVMAAEQADPRVDKEEHLVFGSLLPGDLGHVHTVESFLVT